MSVRLCRDQRWKLSEFLFDWQVLRQQSSPISDSVISKPLVDKVRYQWLKALHWYNIAPDCSQVQNRRECDSCRLPIYIHNLNNHHEYNKDHNYYPNNELTHHHFKKG